MSCAFNNGGTRSRILQQKNLSWKQQVLLTFRGFNLEGYLFGTLHVPYMVDDGEGNNVANLNILSFLSKIVLLLPGYWPISKELVGCMTAAPIWSKLQRHFSSSSTTRIMNLYDLLKVRMLFNQSMWEYLTKIQLIGDNLSGC